MLVLFGFSYERQVASNDPWCYAGCFRTSYLSEVFLHAGIGSQDLPGLLHSLALSPQPCVDINGCKEHSVSMQYINKYVRQQQLQGQLTIRIATAGARAVGLAAFSFLLFSVLATFLVLLMLLVAGFVTFLFFHTESVACLVMCTDHCYVTGIQITDNHTQAVLLMCTTDTTAIGASDSQRQGTAKTGKT